MTDLPDPAIPSLSRPALIAQLRAAVRQAEQMMKQARANGDLEVFHAAQVQHNALQRQLEQAKNSRRIRRNKPQEQS